MTTFGSPAYYSSGAIGVSPVYGYDNGENRIVRFSFTTGDKGALHISITTAEGTVRFVEGSSLSTIPFYITKSDTSYADANRMDGYSATGYITESVSGSGSYAGTADIVLAENTTYYIWFFPNNKDHGWAYWNNSSEYSTSYSLDGISKHTLTLDAGDGTTLSVNRTFSSIGGNTGTVFSGETVYTGDKLKIECAVDNGKALSSLLVNGGAISSGSTYSVESDTAISSLCHDAVSGVSAADANIGSVSMITIQPNSAFPYHSVKYSFGTLVGYITESGSTQDAEVIVRSNSIPFHIPDSFYEQTTDSKTNVCTITCTPYTLADSSASAGNVSVCSFKVTAASEPTVTGSVVDINDVTVALSGDNTSLIRYRSTALATITSSPTNSATIVSEFINGQNVFGADSQRAFNNVSESTFVFSATDSRGYTSETSLSPTVIPYVPLTLNVGFSRSADAETELYMECKGSFYNDKFGSHDSALDNTLSIIYRYREAASDTWSDWTTLQTAPTYTGHSYSTSPISIGTGFDVLKPYVFEVRATDGASEYILTDITKTVQVNRGVPVFDWGANDFEFHVPVKIDAGSITIGTTTLTETQLQKLLTLITD